MSPREENGQLSTSSSSSQVDYTQRDAVETYLISQTPCDDDDVDGHCMKPSDLAKLRTLDGNDVCIDCGEPNPVWASTSLGIFMCLECSGQHRALGTHVSKVRSVNMDSWSPDQLGLMTVGGNKQCVRFLKQHGLRRHHSIVQRYDCAAAMWYQEILKARRDGTAEPKEMPDYAPTRRGVLGRDSIQGIGSTHNNNNSSSTHQSRGSFSLGNSFHGTSWTLSPGALSPRMPRRKGSFQHNTTLQQQEGGGVSGNIPAEWKERGKLMEQTMVDGARSFIRKLSLGVGLGQTPQDPASTPGSSSIDDDKKTTIESFSSEESPSRTEDIDEDDDIDDDCSLDEFGE